MFIKSIVLVLVSALIAVAAYAGGPGGQEGNVKPEGQGSNGYTLNAGDGGGPKMVRGGGIGFSSVKPEGAGSNYKAEGAGTNFKAQGAEGNYRLKGAEGNGPMGHGSNG